MLRTLVVPSIVLAAIGCRPLLDGGWQGTAACPNEAYPISAILNETNEGEIEGVVYIEGINIIIGDVIARGTIDDGEVDPEAATVAVALALAAVVAASVPFSRC